MCGRYLAIIEDDFALMNDIIDDFSDKFNKNGIASGEVFPTNIIPVVYSYNGRNILSTAKWGFPGFKKSGVIINARAETLAEKPMFRNAFAEKRCLIPARGYFEWLTHEDKKKTKYLITVKEKRIFYMAGLYNIFKDDKGMYYAATTIITTDATSKISFIHNRMPVILRDDLIHRWLYKGTSDLKSLQSLLVPYEAEEISFQAV
ncbi:MAG TPA: SOS response-associated peptidase [Clostridiaceae bacterium]|nr:SOS response-associated peptidase [Clostridiaceae bacterium]